jgi:hypothetical protein
VSPGEAYILLGLRLGRHVDGLVDAYYGPTELNEQVAAEPVAEPAVLIEQADALLAALDGGWLRDQAVGLRTYAGVLAGEQLSYSDEVEGCYGVRPQRVSTDAYAAAHERLDELLPGSGPIDDRYESWRRRSAVAPELIVPVMKGLVAELRARTAELVELPTGEELVLEEVRDEPWWAFNYYLGGLKSRVVFNLDVPTTCDDLVEVAAHEVYPGHHTEHAIKERRFVLDRGELEEAIKLVPTPECLVSEGLAEAGPDVVFHGDMPERLAGILAGHGLDYDFETARAIRTARRPLRRVGLDTALLIHEDGAPVEEAEEYLRRWSLVTPEQAAHSVSFVTDPTWRAYVINYSVGRELCHAWVGGDPARFVRLLTEHIRVSDLLPAVSSTP